MIKDLKNDSKKEFLEKEADAWFERNLHAIEKKEYSFGTGFIKEFLDRQHISKEINILEIGCSFGYNLNYLLHNFNNVVCYGIEPSQKAIEYGISEYNKHVSSRRLVLLRGTIDELPFDDSFFDIVIVGFCFCYLDRKLLMRSEMEIDRILKTEGFLAITDFNAVMNYKRMNIHNSNTPVYKTKYADHFIGRGYSCIEKTTYTASSESFFPFADQERVSTTILFKEPLEQYYNIE